MRMTIDDAKRMVSANPTVVDFGTTGDAVGEEWIANAESALGREFPVSYKWFLKTYAGGEIGGEEIFSVYGLPFESAVGGDIVFKHLVNRKNGLLDDSKLVISATDFGEIFFFDYDKWSEGEAPIYLHFASCNYPYAADFYGFLCKRIIAHSP